MSIYMYKTQNDYYYAVEIGMPEHTVQFGEGFSPEAAVRDLKPTQYQSADFSCQGPSNEEFRRRFNADLYEDDTIIDCTEEEERTAQAAYEGRKQGDHHAQEEN